MTTSEPASSGGWESPALPLMWSPGEPHASPSPVLAGNGHRRMSGGSGLRSPRLFAAYDPGTRSWKTSRVSLLGESETYSATWPRSGTTRSGTAFPLSPSAPLIDVIGSSWLPTPTARLGDPKRGLPSPALAQRRRASGRRNLDDAVMWPTPTVNVNRNRASYPSSGGDGLQTAVGGALNPTWVEWLMGFPPGWTESAA